MPMMPRVSVDLADVRNCRLDRSRSRVIVGTPSFNQEDFRQMILGIYNEALWMVFHPTQVHKELCT